MLLNGWSAVPSGSRGGHYVWICQLYKIKIVIVFFRKIVKDDFIINNARIE
ncbi:MAG: hypothetical protein M3Z01_03295 [Thermoproteota archaeon]|nr:hypothetical protein [Thermoproteota archaeon]